jgi:hypothetical protein
MKNGANSPFITSGSSPPEACSANTSHDNSKKIWMTSDEAASYLRCNIKTLYNYKCNGKLTGHNRGGTQKGQLLFDKSELDLFITGKGGRNGHIKK